MKKFSSWKWLMLGAALASLAGCAKSDDGGASTGTTTTTTGAAGTANASGSDKPLELAFITNNVSDYWNSAEKGTEKGATEANVKVDFEKPPTGTVAEQKQIIDDMLSKGVQGIAISPDDPTNAIPMLNDAAKKALLITQDSDAPTSNRTFYIGTDNKAAGKQLGEALIKALPNGGKVLVFVGQIDVENAKERYAGLQEAIKANPKIQILDLRTDGADHQVAKSNAATAIVKYPDLAAMVGLWSYNGPAILSAVKDANKVGKIKIICFDAEPDTVTGLQDGSIDATVVQQPFQFGEQSVVLMAKYLRGDKTVVPADKQILIPTQIVDKTSIGKYEDEQNKLLGK